MKRILFVVLVIIVSVFASACKTAEDKTTSPTDVPKLTDEIKNSPEMSTDEFTKNY